MRFPHYMVVRALRSGLLALALTGTAGHANPAPAQPTPSASAFTCSLGVESAPAPVAAPATYSSDPDCLIALPDLGDAGSLYDVRSRAEFVASHIPGATHTTPGALMTMPGARTRAVVVYDAGKFRTDALMLCERLRKAGMANAKVLDGGFVSWSQATRHPSRLTAARLSDSEVAAALGTPTTRVVAISPELETLANGVTGQDPDRVLLLAGPDLPAEELQRAMDKAPMTAFYWLGTAGHLGDLVHRHAAQNRKRIAGPSESPICDSL